MIDFSRLIGLVFWICKGLYMYSQCNKLNIQQLGEIYLFVNTRYETDESRTWRIGELVLDLSFDQIWFLMQASYSCIVPFLFSFAGRQPLSRRSLLSLYQFSYRLSLQTPKSKSVVTWLPPSHLEHHIICISPLIRLFNILFNWIRRYAVLAPNILDFEKLYDQLWSKFLKLLLLPPWRKFTSLGHSVILCVHRMSENKFGE